MMTPAVADKVKRLLLIELILNTYQSMRPSIQSELRTQERRLAGISKRLRLLASAMSSSSRYMAWPI